MSLQKIINENYCFHVIGLIQLSPCVYKVKTETKFYCLKIVENKKLETAYNHITTLKLEHFVRLIPNREHHCLTCYGERYFYVMEYLEADKDIKKEMKLKTYYEYLAYLHHHSFFYQHIEKDFLKKQKQDLFNIIQERKNQYENFMKQFELMKFRSPSGWMLVLNYYRMSECFHQAYRYLNDYYEMMNNQDDMRLSLTYNHFSYEHIFIYESQLISIDRMRIDFCIYDIYDMFQNIEPMNENYDSLFTVYLQNVDLLQEEKLLLSCLLSIIPQIQFIQDEEHNIIEMSRVLCYMESINRIIQKLKIDSK